MFKAIVFIMLILFSFSSFAADIQIIAANSVPDTKLTNVELLHIFTRKKMFWSNGQKIKVFIKPADSIEHKFFTINVLNLTPYKFKTITESVVYSGENTPAVEVNSDEEMLTKISLTPYSIGYLNYNTIIVHAGSDVVTINYE